VVEDPLRLGAGNILSMPPEPEEQAPERRRSQEQTVRLLRWPALAAFGIVVAFLALLVALERVERWGRAAAHGPAAAAAAAERLARGMLTGRVTESFLATLPALEPAGGGKLEVAVAHATEVVTRTDERRALFDLVDLGVTTAEIRVPVTYRYHVRFDEPWRMTIAGGVCRVEAPALRPSLPPAIHTDGMEKRIESSWLRFDGPEQLSRLERELTPTLSRMAGDARHLDFARDRARATVAQFVRGWLLAAGAWGEGGVAAVDVRFADEPEPPAAESPRL
jgi:hypothetical protein